MTYPVLQINTPETTCNQHSIEVDFLLNNEPHKVYYRSRREAVLTGNTESFLASTILPCMRLGGGQIRAEGDVSQQFFSALPTIQDIYCSWENELRRVEIKNSIPVSRTLSTENRVGAFFSGGVDSFYTFLKHQNEITDLILVHGFDIQLENTSLRKRVSENINNVASSFGKNVIEIETNLRDFLNPFGWGLGHGASLAAIGHLLYPLFHRIYIPSTHTYANLFPWGSHPILDHLWSSEALEFLHDGCEATRVEKVAVLAKHEIALQTLRVCMASKSGSYNCGRCEKCLRTMINLRVTNALDRCPTFDDELRIKNVLKIVADNENTRSFVRENLDALKRGQRDQELMNALQKVLNGPRLSQKLLKGFKIRKRLKRILVNIKERFKKP